MAMLAISLRRSWIWCARGVDGRASHGLQNLEHLTKADILSLGMSLYELASLDRLPVNGPAWQQVGCGARMVSISSHS